MSSRHRRLGFTFLAAACAAALCAHAYRPDTGLTRFIGFSTAWHDRELPAVRAVPHVDDPNGVRRRYGSNDASTFVFYFDRRGKLLYKSAVPASPGDASLSFFGIVYDDARIAKVVVKSGDTQLKLDADVRRDAVAMDDFIYGEPQQK